MKKGIRIRLKSNILLMLLLLTTKIFAYEIQVPRQPASACFTDLNADGFQDIILGHKTGWGYTNPSISILLNDSFGRFSVVDTSLSFCGYQDNLLIHDVDNDGNPDLIALTSDFSGGTTNPLRYLRVFNDFSLNNHTFIDYPLVRNNTIFKVICIDLPNNEHAICWISAVGYYWGYIRFSESGIPQTPVFFDITLPPGDIIYGDINDNGLLDICVKVFNTLLVWQWTGSEFTPLIYPNELWGYYDFLIDINQDDEIELLDISVFDTARITLYSIPDFIVQDSIVVTPNLTYPQLYDLNGDNYLDILYTSSLFNPYHWDHLYHTWIVFFNGTSFSNPLTLNTGYSSYKSYPIDFNNDSFIDIVTLNDYSVTSGHINILYNDGNGSFQETSPTPNEDNLAHISQFKLSCYPNPFQETTAINVKTQIPLVNPMLEIFNIKGQRIKSLKLRNDNSGEISVTWDGTDNFQKQVSSGIYFLKIKSDNIQRGFTKCFKY